MRLLLFIATFSLLSSACKEPGSIGAGLLQNQEFLIEYTDEIIIPGKVVQGDSIVIYSDDLYKSIGITDGPIFGETKNQIFLNTTYNSTTDLLPDPDFSDATLDSIVLRIPLSQDHHYGDTTAMHHVEVIQLTNYIVDDLETIGLENLTSFNELPFDESNVIGDTIFTPNYIDSIAVNSHVVDTILLFEPHLRVKIDNSFGEIFFDDQMNLETDSSYTENAKGFVIRSTPSTSSMLGLDMSNPAVHTLAFYYTREDGGKSVYPFDLGGFSHLNVQHEYEGTGTDIEAALNDQTIDQELLYAESYSGTNIEFDFTPLLAFQDEIINYATLEFTLADVAGYNTDLYHPIENFLVSYTNEEDELRLIPDITALNSSSIAVIEELFGGNPEIDGLTGEVTYKMNVSTIVRNFISGDLDNSDLILTLTTFNRSTEPNRSIIYGSGNTVLAPKLKLVVSTP